MVFLVYLPLSLTKTVKLAQFQTSVYLKNDQKKRLFAHPKNQRNFSNLME